jgi:hypothetical protein
VSDFVFVSEMDRSRQHFSTMMAFTTCMPLENPNTHTVPIRLIGTSGHRRSIFDVKLLNAMFLHGARKCLIASRLPRQANFRRRHRRRSEVRNPGKQTRLKLFLRSIKAHNQGKMVRYCPSAALTRYRASLAPGSHSLPLACHDSLHLDFHAHPGMDAALKAMLTFR